MSVIGRWHPFPQVGERGALDIGRHREGRTFLEDEPGEDMWSVLQMG